MEFTALTALGTIADVVPLTGENRIIVRHGLTQLLRTKNPGLLALTAAAGYGKDDNGQGKKIDCTAVGFALAPRLNAAGRMGHAREAVELLTTATPERAEEITRYLESQNRERQSTEKKMLEIAKNQIENRKSKIENPESVLVISHTSFHAGIVGIVASRIVDLYHRPTFVLAQSDVELHGSARSIAGFELHLAIEHTRDLLTSGGGHAMAGGVKLPLANLDAFRDRLNAFASDKLTDDLLTPAMTLDGTLSLDECKADIIAHLEKLEPFGRGNPTPRFLVQNVRLTAPPRRVGATGAHLQLTIARGTRVARCIAFKMGELEPQLPVGTELNLVVEPKIDCFNGNTRVDLVVSDIARCDNEPLNASPSPPLVHQSTT
jgi:single-stranded-DNA-specific exonuclease